MIWMIGWILRKKLDKKNKSEVQGKISKDGKKVKKRKDGQYINKY